MTVLLIGGLPSSLTNFRGALLDAIRAAGHQVVAAANGRDEATEATLAQMNVRYRAIRVARAGMNPLADAITLLDIVRIIWSVRPHVVLTYTIKPVVHGGLGAWLCRVPRRYSLITGLGYALADRSCHRQRLAGWVARALYRVCLRRSHRVFFQNPDDRDAFLGMKLVSPEQCVVVNGSGVDLNHFRFADCTSEPRPQPVRTVPTRSDPSAACDAVPPFRFLLIARLLRSKGISEYADAARVVKRQYPWAEFHLVGPFDPNPMALTPEDIRKWEDEGLLHFHGHQCDVRRFIENCHVYVLPSYREGTPRTVLEAMAMGRAIITTDTPGCRETIRFSSQRNGVSPRARTDPVSVGDNGLLVPPRDSAALATAMEVFLTSPAQALIMGRASREYAEQRYDVERVNSAMLHAMELLADSIAAAATPIRRGDSPLRSVSGSGV
jgi:glycosyltransferase involved in cell wall biosynthesis